MSEKLSGAVEELENQLAEQLQEVANTKKLINSLLKRMGQEPRYTDISVEHVGAMRADEYYGKPLATAVQMYLDRRHQAVSGEEILRGLEQGGFNFEPLNWKDSLRLRNLVISLVKSSKTFHRLPNGTFGLTAWYDAARITTKKRAENEEAGEEAKSSTEEEPEEPAKAAAS